MRYTAPTLFAILLSLMCGSACIDSPLGGGFASAPPCPSPSGNSAWTSSGISILRKLPDKCPFVVSVASQPLDFAFDASAGKSNIPGSALCHAEYRGLARLQSSVLEPFLVYESQRRLKVSC